MVDNLVKDLNFSIVTLLKTYTSGEFTITKDMLREYEKNELIQVTNNPDGSVTLRIVDLGGIK